MFQLYKYDTSLAQHFGNCFTQLIFRAPEDLLLACSPAMFVLFGLFCFVWGRGSSACLVVAKLVPCLFTRCAYVIFFFPARQRHTSRSTWLTRPVYKAAVPLGTLEECQAACPLSETLLPPPNPHPHAPESESLM